MAGRTYTITEIAEAAGCGKTTVRRIVKRLGLQPSVVHQGIQYFTEEDTESIIADFRPGGALTGPERVVSVDDAAEGCTMDDRRAGAPTEHQEDGAPSDYLDDAPGAHRAEGAPWVHQNRARYGTPLVKLAEVLQEDILRRSMELAEERHALQAVIELGQRDRERQEAERAEDRKAMQEIVAVLRADLEARRQAEADLRAQHAEEVAAYRAQVERLQAELAEARRQVAELTASAQQMEPARTEEPARRGLLGRLLGR